MAVLSKNVGRMGAELSSILEIAKCFMVFFEYIALGKLNLPTYCRLNVTWGAHWPHK